MILTEIKFKKKKLIKFTENSGTTNELKNQTYLHSPTYVS